MIYNALVKPLDELREKAELMPATIGDGLTLIGNALMKTLGVFDQAGEAIAGFASSLVVIADNMGRIATYAMTAAVAYGAYYAATLALDAASKGLAVSLALVRAALIPASVSASRSSQLANSLTSS